MIHIGIDFHQRFMQVAVLHEDGSYDEARLLSRREAVREFFGRFDKPVRVAVESGYGWYWLVEELEMMGHEVHLSNPVQTKAIAHARLKNDRVDAIMLANLLRGDLLPTVWIPPRELREGKELVRHREKLVRIRASAKQMLWALMSKHGYRPKVRTWFTETGRNEMEQIDLSGSYAMVRENGLGLMDYLQAQIAGLDVEITKRVSSDRKAKLLSTIPGIGRFIAYALSVHVGNIGRFPSSKHFASYFGLVPSEHSSGGHVRRGHITKQGNRLMRWLFVEAAQVAVRVDPTLKSWYRRVRSRRGSKIAMVAVARKLATAAYHVLKDGIPYHEVILRHSRGDEPGIPRDHSV
jgi:transposase